MQIKQRHEILAVIGEPIGYAEGQKFMKKMRRLI